ncbi:MAG: ribonuclease J [Candidatus Midichloriaceae bacterium]|jgi:ribonuclease J
MKKLDLKKYKGELLFVPIGGSGEIGMNLNLYGYNGKWIIVDMGLGFADVDLPGVTIIVPNINFIINEIKDDLLGLVLTHAHEDHIGAIPYLWSELKCKMYATKFTAEVIKAKCRDFGIINEVEIIETYSNKEFTIGDFNINMTHITHSIPEMNGILIKTKKGNIFHTGDWKFDPNPVIGEATDENELKKIGDSNILAMVGDSTNIFDKKHSGSEGELGKNLEKLVSANKKNLVIVTTFASNVARIQSIANAAKKSGKKIVLLGRSLKRIFASAKEAGYLRDIEIHNEKEISKIKRSDLLIICTGCQGEQLAATSKIADGKHPDVKLKKGDVVIFSSKIIPGNEKKIYTLLNKFSEMNIDVLTEKNEFVHVSGHPSSLEVSKMYEYIKPKIAIPVHGEAIHLTEHVKLAKKSGIKHCLSVRNGDVLLLDDKNPMKIGEVESGYYAVDGNLILDSENEIIKNRRVLRDNGAIFISIVLNHKKKSIKEMYVKSPGVLEESEDVELIEDLKKKIIQVVNSLDTFDTKKIESNLKYSMRKYFVKTLGKSPMICVNIIS